MKTNPTAEKIKQLLRSNNTNQKLGMALLKSTNNADLLIQFIKDPSYLSGYVRYHLISYFQEQPDIWKAVQPQLSSYQQNYFKEWMQYEILAIEDQPTLADFCRLASETMKKKYRNFPKLTPKIITKRDAYGVGCSQEGSSIHKGIGWTLYTDERDIGPAETVHEEEWIATAHHPEGSFVIECDPTRDQARAWMRKIEPN